jgi:hypothetical protein
LLAALRRLLCAFGTDSVTSRLEGPKKKAAFQIVVKRRAHILLKASVVVKNISQFVAVIAS